jgi:diguanylate cyclase (GGDEF)-like protein/PAS domain S-box-containing protein
VADSLASGGAVGTTPTRLDDLPLARSGPQLLLRVFAVGLLYLVSAKLGLKLAFLQASATPVWPPTGIALATLLLFGDRVWPGIFAGAFLANVTTEGTALTSLGIASGNTLEGLVGAWLVRRFAGGLRAFETPGNVFSFAALAGLLSTLVSATLGVSSLGLGGFVRRDAYLPVWLTWWLGDVGGNLVIAPLIILLATGRGLPRVHERRGEAVLLLGALLLVGMTVLGGLLPGVADAPVAFVAIPALLWAAFRFGQGEAAAANALLSGIAVWGVLHGHGPFTWRSPNASLLVLQAFMGISGVTTLAVSAAVAQRRRVEEALARTAAIVDSSDDGIIGKALDGSIMSWNAGAERLYGYTAPEAIGRPISILVPAGRADDVPELLARIRRGESVAAYETERVRKDGRVVVVSLRLSPVRGVAGAIVGASAIARDITEQKGALEQVRRLQKAVETIPVGVTITDMSGRILYTNPAEAAAHGYRVEELIGQHVSVFMPQGWEPSPGRPSEVRSWRRDTVNVRKDATIFPVQLISDAVMGPDGAPIGIVTWSEEITERKRAEEALRSSEERYRLLFESNLAGVYRATLDGRFLECNEAFARILGYPARDLVLPLNAWDFFFDGAAREQSLLRIQDNGSLTNLELRLRRRDGTGVWVLANETLLPGPGGGTIVAGTVSDITDRKLAEERIEFRAYHDPLTGLPNRTFLMDRLNLHIAQARRRGRGMAVMFLDLDRFKIVNDTLGHSLGDRLLCETAERLRQGVREDDTVARIGGDEFVVLLPQVRHGETAARVARKLLRKIGEPFRLDGHELRVTTSIGIVLFPEDGDDPEMVLKKADRAMYRAKEQGRNAYHFHEPAAQDPARGKS